MPVRSRKNNSKNKNIQPKNNESPENITCQDESILFSQLGFSPNILKAVEEIGYKTPTQIQAQAIPIVFQNRDLVGIAQTGTGKTASFTLPILEILSKTRGRARMPRALILEPTRELALQVAENLSSYGKYLKLSHALLIGGESMMDQKDVLNRGVDIIIATPGRLLDLFERGGILLNQIHILVIDEADRMLDMGFIPDVERIIKLVSTKRQTILLSATMPKEIKRLANSFLSDPAEIIISPPSSVAQTIETGLIMVPQRQKNPALRKLLKQKEVQNAIIFCNRKKDVDSLTRSLKRYGFSVGALHGDLSQSHRTETMDLFKKDKIKILVCSDIAARGIDIDNLSHVFNYDLPRQAEDYVHRIGRTGRAGRVGHAYSLATPDDQEVIESIESLTKKSIPIIDINELSTQSTNEDKAVESVANRKDLSKSKRHQKTKSNEQTTSSISPNDNNSNEIIIGFGDFVPSFMLFSTRR